jgi:hypothetical protein
MNARCDPILYWDSVGQAPGAGHPVGDSNCDYRVGPVQGQPESNREVTCFGHNGQTGSRGASDENCKLLDTQ